MRRKVLLAGGLFGPASFITAWAVLSATTDDYSPIENPISRLAAAGAPTRAAMSAGFVSFGVGLLAFAAGYRRQNVLAATALAANGLASFAVAAFPLDTHDSAHAVAAGTAYVTLAAAPLLTRTRGGVVAGVVTAAALAASVLTEERTGLFQRIGLTTGDVWIMASAVSLLRAGATTRESAAPGSSPRLPG